MHMFLSRLSTEEAVKTSAVSRQWVDLWRCRPTLELDMRKLMHTTPTRLMHEVSIEFASSMTKVIKEHCGDLESCVIHHYSSQCQDGTVESWIDTVIREKHTKDLTLVNHLIGCVRHHYEPTVLYLLPNSFSHRSLTSLSLRRFRLVSTHAFKNCSNLKILKLLSIAISEADVLSRVFAACSSLEVIVLEIHCLTRRGVLKIVNNNLKFLQVTSYNKIDRIEVHATCLHVLDIKFIRCERDNFILVAPNVRFNRNYWIARGYPYAHISYDISDLPQEKKSVWHDLMVNDINDKKRHGSLSVSIDISNPKEVDILKEVLLMWGDEMKELEILFKENNAYREEGERSINCTSHEKLWENTKPFPNTDFRVSTVRMYNFSGSNQEEFAFASHFVMQNMVIEKMMIKTSSFSPMKKLKVEADVTKLIELSKGNEDLSIECF
ncbi:unnamed protein product [Arabis nemorensis]|uniref:F-box domain-containing protein n=1 Tax=Arabis nemorensis TaxID=586526 RepID=A0A565BYF9_9BRAS|nr:unnamed protein product [Arabis nemorensis]